MTKKEFEKYMVDYYPFGIENQYAFNQIKDLKRKLEAYRTYYMGKPSYYGLQVELNEYEIKFLIDLLREVFGDDKSL